MSDKDDPTIVEKHRQPAGDDHDAETMDSGKPSGGQPTVVDDELPARIPEQIGHYKIKRVIAAGGMGVVYEALQEQPRRTVALKVMKQGIASRSALRRFEYESQILGRLRHAGIAQVYEAGMHDDGTGGVPYFAMEYIAGAKDVCEYAQSKELSTRERLELFDKVCDAVHHGHQKGIIHRDLKPPNILCDSSGQPKIIDFGVARATDSDLAVPTLQTDVGQLVGTIQYMSPEQIEADPHDIDTRSDVYALGVILYKLLTERLPYDVSGTVIYEATRIVREQHPKPISRIDRTLRGDVETIVFHALEKDRDRRYQSAIEMASDIRRYLNNRPILARPPSLAYTFKTFVRRNKLLVAATAAVFIALVMGIVGTSWQWKRADEQRAAAEAQRDRAERMFGQVKSLAHTFMFDFHDAVQKLDGSVPARELLVTTALKYLAGLAAEASDRPDVMLEVAMAYDRVGDIEGGIRNPGLGDKQGALANYRKALAIREDLSAADPDNAELRNEIAKSHWRTGDILKNTGDVSGALEAYEKALNIREELAELNPAHYGRAVALSLTDVGAALMRLGRLREAKQTYERALGHWKKLAAAEPGDSRLKRDLSVGYGRMGLIFASMCEYDLALRRFQEQHGIRQSLLEREPDSGRARRDLAVAHFFVGGTLLELERPSEALPHVQHFLDTSLQRSEANPKADRPWRDLAVAHEYVGWAHMDLEAFGTAGEHFRQFHELTSKLSDSYPENTHYRELHARSYQRLGELAAARDDLPEAIVNYRESLNLLDGLVTEDPENFLFKSVHARLLKSLGENLLKSGDHREAARRLESARAALESLAAEQPEDCEVATGLDETRQILSELVASRQ